MRTYTFLCFVSFCLLAATYAIAVPGFVQVTDKRPSKLLDRMQEHVRKGSLQTRRDVIGDSALSMIKVSLRINCGLGIGSAVFLGGDSKRAYFASVDHVFYSVSKNRLAR